jgi:hypothetical protein
MNGDDWGHGRAPWRVARIVGMVIAGVIGAAVFALAFGWFVQLLWNWLMPAIFGLGTIGYWQAFGLVILGKLIFGSIHGGGAHKPRRDRGQWEKHGQWGPPAWDREWGRDRWGLWKDFWKDEGRESFERYVKQREAGSGTPMAGTADAPKA